jgi:hypothetical protein
MDKNIEHVVKSIKVEKKTLSTLNKRRDFECEYKV